MVRRYLGSVLLVAVLGVPTLAVGQPAILAVPPESGLAGQDVNVAVRISTDLNVSFLQFTLDFNAHVASFESVQIGSDLAAAGLSISNVNDDLPFPPVTTGTTDNVLVQIFGSGTNTFTGQDLEAAVLTFRLSAQGCGTSPMAFDPDCAHTQLSSSEQGLVCNPSLDHGTLTIECTSDAERTVRNFHLRQNVPNPFNPSTRIQFSTPTTGAARLVVFDAAGHIVRVLVDTPLPNGFHEVVWDGRDDAGNGLPTGVYFYRLSIPGQSATRRTLLLK